MNVLVSACLLGLPCRYGGDGYPLPVLEELLARPGLHFVLVCPEQLGGLPTPRPPDERVGERVLTNEGVGVTAAYERGAAQAAALAVRLRCGCALLKARSPSSGSGAVYDGTFTGRRVPGDGTAAAAVKAVGLPVFTEEERGAFLAFLGEEGRG